MCVCGGVNILMTKAKWQRHSPPFGKIQFVGWKNSASGFAPVNVGFQGFKYGEERNLGIVKKIPCKLTPYSPAPPPPIAREKNEVIRSKDLLCSNHLISTSCCSVLHCGVFKHSLWLGT